MSDPHPLSQAERARLRALLESVKPGGSIELFADEVAVVLSLLAALDEGERYKAAIRWALGYEDFAPRAEGQGAYWWRRELAERSGYEPEPEAPADA